jgi:NADH-quinone oxidoreductase subunit G
MGKEITINIDGKVCKCNEGELILNVARANDIYIPAICYLTRCSPTLACRLCLVEIDGKQAYGCNAKAKDGMNVLVHTENIALERKSIMQVYDVNHPLQCGVCDQSGECELQNYTLDLKVDSQQYAIADSPRPTQDWGLRKYDPGLCIVCERCVTACKDMVGDSAIKTVPRGGEQLDKSLKETLPKDTFAMWNKLQKSLIGGTDGDNYECSDCGECTAVCPVGALVSSDFQYTSNAWELNQIPATCAHCSNGCQIYYEVKHTTIDNPEEKIYRVKNEFHYNSLCAAGRYGYDFQNTNTKDEEAFSKAIEAFNKADAIKFTSQITNEEALILEKISQKLNLKLVNEDAREFKNFLDDYSSVSGQKYYGGNREDVHNSNFIISVGTQLRTDSPIVRYAMNNSLKMNKGAGLYFHPVGDALVETLSKTIKTIEHKPMAEEAVMYLILELFANKDELPEATKSYLDSFRETRVKTVTETIKEKITEKTVDASTGEEVETTKMVPKKVSKEISIDYSKLLDLVGLDDSFYDDLEKFLAKKDSYCLVVGSDFYTHPRSKNLAKLCAMVEKYTNFKLVMIPSDTNTLGVSQICTLQSSASINNSYTIGYNTKGDFTLSALGDGDMDIPALNQQEGTFTNINKKVLPTNVAISYDGYNLNDIANALGINAKYTIDYTKELPQSSGYKCVDFDSLPNEFLNSIVENRGYELENLTVEVTDSEIAAICEAKEYSNTIIYKANPELHFNEFTKKSHQLKDRGVNQALASKEFMEANSLADGDSVEIAGKNGKLQLSIKSDKYLKGDVVTIPFFDTKIDTDSLFDGYRFSEASIRKV